MADGGEAGAPPGQGRKRRWDADVAGAGGGGAAPPTKRRVVSLDALRRAKAALQAQKGIGEKLKELREGVLGGAGAAGGAGSAPPAQPLKGAAPPVVTEPSGPTLPEAPVEEEEAQPFFDSRMGPRWKQGAVRRRRAGFEFSEPGEFQAQALQDRLHARLGGAIEQEDLAALKAQGGAGGRAVEAFERMEAGASGALRAGPPPVGVEWWDAALLPGRSYPSDGGVTDFKKVTQYVEHPVPVEPEFERPAPAAQPLRLTKKEHKKMRKQRREAREKEKQEMIRQGLLEPPKPKVKISNLARVLGEAAAADPTKIEREVRDQAAERQRAHDDRNLARKLTPAERRQRKLKKLFGPGLGDGLREGEQALAAVFKVGHLDHGQVQYKVKINAQQNHLMGCALRSSGLCAVVVEGGQKALQRFKRLMLARIQWDAPLLEAGGGEGGLAGEASAAGAALGATGSALPPNYCELVWEGPVPGLAFGDFRMVTLKADFLARAYLEERGVAHYWDLAASFQATAA